jgi:hypothetical protein
MYFLHRELTGYEYGWRPPRQHQPLKRRRVPPRIKFFSLNQKLWNAMVGMRLIRLSVRRKRPTTDGNRAP